MTQPEMSIDGGLTMRDVQRYVDRDRDPQISSANSLIELLGEVRHVRKALEALNEGQALFGQTATNEPRESRSSVEIDSNASAGKFKIKAKHYADSITEARAGAFAEFVRAMADLERAQAAGWAESVVALERDGAHGDRP